MAARKKAKTGAALQHGTCFVCRRFRATPDDKRNRQVKNLCCAIGKAVDPIRYTKNEGCRLLIK